jgi:hypothetical protein
MNEENEMYHHNHADYLCWQIFTAQLEVAATDVRASSGRATFPS